MELEKKGRKQLTATIIKAEEGEEETGKVLARFGTSGVKDLDGDVIERGAIGGQPVKVSAFGHTSWQGSLPVGKGITREDGDEQLADLSFFMDTTHGRDHFLTMKALGELGEWSYGFDILESRAPTDEERQLGIRQVISQLAVHEVSPVLRGAGIDTATLEAKCDACALKTETEAAAAARAAAEAAAGEQLTAEQQKEAELKETIALECGKAALILADIETR
jgi:hypothetical protein